MKNIPISVQHLSKSFNFWSERPETLKSLLVNILKGKFTFGAKSSFQVLDDVSFDIAVGEFVGIMGKNGAGKSTLLKLISGIYTPSSGKVITQGTIAPLIELGAGFHPDLTGYENIFLNASILGFGKKATQAALPSIVEFSELGEHLNRPIRNYSSGMMVRLGFSIATHLDAPTLLIDEVLAVGDQSFQRKCIQKIEELHRSGRTIVLITHDPAAVRDHCTRCIVIDKSKKIFDGPAAEGVKVYEEKNE
jgi:ABC-type polysaccharide/polyol phosphate transport system ATPase subunit